jgi:hypothetical protein
MLVCSLLVAAACATPVAEAQAQRSLPFTLDVIAKSGQDVTLTIPPNGQIPLTIIRTDSTSPQPASLTLALSPFVGEQGNSITVQLSFPNEPSRAKQPVQRDVAVTSGLLPILLAVPKLPAGGKYTGQLIVTAKGKAPPLVWRIILSPGVSHPAVLVLDREVVTLGSSPCILWRCGAPEFSVNLREKTGQWPLEGISARLEQVTKAPPTGFDLGKNVKFEFNGKGVSDFTSSAGAELRVIPKGEQGTVRMTFRNLPAGEYNAVIRFQASNSTEDDAQRLVLTLQIRDSIWLATLVLILAVLFSFLATKVLNMLRKRLAFGDRLGDLRPPWLSSEPNTFPVIWVRAAIRQAEELTRRYWLTGEDQIEAQVSQISSIVGVLEKIRQYRQAFSQEALPGFVRVRAFAALRRIATRLDGTYISDQTITQLKAELDTLSAWLQSTQQKGYYWAALSQDVTALVSEVTPATIAYPAARDEMERLIAILVDPRVPETLTGMMSVEDQYARLKILWERRNSPEFSKLVALQLRKPILTDLFTLADQQAWDRLKAAATSPDGISVTLPQDNGLDPVLSYDPLIFKVNLRDRELGVSYLFLHELKYEWEIKLEFKGGVLRLCPISDEPQVVQYVPKPGKLSATVHIWHGEKVDAGVTLTTSVAKSKDFSSLKLFERVELISFVLAGIAAIVSGLAIYYAKSASFGSLQDYLTLFVWGAGVDQGKNFLQSLQAYSAVPSKPA